MKEIRSFDQIEFRVTPETRKVGGYALMYNTKSRDLGGFVEIIEKDAMKGVLDKSDVLALYNHDDNRVLARNTFGNGTLTLKDDNKGLFYEFEAPNTADGNDLLYHLEKGNIRNSSFAFTIAEGGQKWEKIGDTYVRTITQFDRIFDVSPCWTPAYQSTTVALRAFDEFKKEDINMTDEKREVKIEVSVEIEEKEPDEMPEMPTTTEMPENPVEEDALEMIEVIYNGNSYNVPKRLLEDIINETDQKRKLDEYFIDIEKSIDQLKN